LILINYRSNEAVSKYKKLLGYRNYRSNQRLYRRFTEVMEKNWDDVKKQDFDHWINQGLSFYNCHQQTRFCVECLKEDKYHRISWIIIPMIVCRKHKILLFQNCNKCDKAITIHDTVWGCCINCGNSLLQNKYEQNDKIYDFVDWTGDIHAVTHSPYWHYNCDISTFYKLMKWLMHNLSKFFPNTFSFEMSDHDKKNLPKYRQITDLENLYSLHQSSYELLNDWPNKLFLFLKELEEGENKQKVIEFVKMFFLRHTDPILNKLLRQVHEREWFLYKDYYHRSNYNEENPISKSHTIIDRNYLNINEVCKFFGFSKFHLQKYVTHFQYNIIEHPRNGQMYMSVSDLQSLLKRKSQSIRDLPQGIESKFISKEDLALLWGTTERAAEITSNILEIQTTPALDELGYNKWEAHYQTEFVKTIVTIEELANRSVWTKKSIRNYLFYNNVNEVTGKGYSSVSINNIILDRKEAVNVFNSLSNDVNDYYSRRQTLDILGPELFRISYILPMHIEEGPLNVTTLYNKSDVQLILEMSKDNSLKVIERMRSDQSMKMRFL
jgi:hypothetical protein